MATRGAPGSPTGFTGLVGHGRLVYAHWLVHPHSPGRPRLEFAVAPAGTTRWRRIAVDLPHGQGVDGAGVAAYASSRWVLTGVESRHPVALRSVDAGRTFTRIPGYAGVSCLPTSTSPRVIWTTCSTGTDIATCHAVADKSRPGCQPSWAG